MADGPSARARLCDPAAEVSAHWLIHEDGRSEALVPEDRRAWHAGAGSWQGRDDVNSRSIGIELVNIGRYPHWLDSRHQAMDEAYTEDQIEALVALLRDLHARIPSLALIAGHEDLDLDEVEASDDPELKVRRKRDPGPRFPWQRVLAAVPLERIGAPGDARL